MNNKHINKIVCLDSINSTNEYLLNNYKNFDSFTLVKANSQTSGRGRKGHNWISSGDNIYMSLLLKPNNIDSPNLLTLVVGLSLSKTIDKLYKVNTSIKWPNDIFLNDKKLSGILVESKYTNKLECIVIGIGINVNQLDFNNDELRYASSLLKETNLHIDKDIIINEFINNFYELYKLFISNGFNQFINEINNKLYILNKEIYVTSDPSINGLALGISNIGELLVKTNNGIISLNSKEVSIKAK